MCCNLLQAALTSSISSLFLLNYMILSTTKEVLSDLHWSSLRRYCCSHGDDIQKWTKCQRPEKMSELWYTHTCSLPGICSVFFIQLERLFYLAYYYTKITRLIAECNLPASTYSGAILTSKHNSPLFGRLMTQGEKRAAVFAGQGLRPGAYGHLCHHRSAEMALLCRNTSFPRWQLALLAWKPGPIIPSPESCLHVANYSSLRCRKI